MSSEIANRQLGQESEQLARGLLRECCALGQPQHRAGLVNHPRLDQVGDQTSRLHRLPGPDRIAAQRPPRPRHEGDALNLVLAELASVELVVGHVHQVLNVHLDLSVGPRPRAGVSCTTSGPLVASFIGAGPF
jgi:hypothetical protein